MARGDVMHNYRGNTLQILHTNDLHSHFPEMARIATGMKFFTSLAEKKGHYSVRVDLGDHMDRMYGNTEATWGQANIDVMNAMGYRWVIPGNNEGLTFPREKFDLLYERGNFQVLCANLVDANNGQLLPFLKPYVIEEYPDGFTVAWIGLTAPYYRFYDLLGLAPLPPIDKAKEILEEVRDKVDLVVLLSHMGYNADLDLASQVKGIDLILGSHTHTLLPRGERVNETFICQAGSFGNYFGLVEIRYNQNKKIEEMKAACIPAADYPPDRKITALLQKQYKRSREILDVEVVHLGQEIPVSWREESPLGNVLAMGLKSWVDADLGIVNSGTLLHSLPPGPVTRKQLLEICPHPINPCKMKLTGEQLKEIFEEALFREVIERELRGFGFRGKKIGWLNVAGARIYYDSAYPKGNRIRNIWIGNQPLHEKGNYTIGTIDMFTFGVVFPTFKQGKDLRFYFPELLRDVLQKELGNEKSIKASYEQHWLSF